ncbi:MAG: nuclear transport factor 2 family protein [Gammaproteobacteria bacterium]|nr:nuclear transport factor 2 family protein [Gammaproteobacteria bacterium]
MSDFNDVTETLKIYFDALYYCDRDKLATAFHPQAIYATADETPLLYRTMGEYFPIVAARESGASRCDVRRDIVDGIEFAGENTAFARVRCSIGQRSFVDFLTLVREANRWKIIAKVFQIVESNQ